MSWGYPPDTGLTFVGAPLELVRVTDPVYADQARTDWRDYLRKTLAATQSSGGRFNPRGEFGAIYTSEDEATAWEETASRFRRQGIEGLSPEMRLLRMIVMAGRYADFTDSGVRRDWGVSLGTLRSPVPTGTEEDICWDLAREVRAVADFLQSPSARGPGSNIPLYPDREFSGLEVDFSAVLEGRVPAPLRQRPEEQW